MPLALRLAALALVLGACDVAPALDIETPPYQEAVVVRAVLSGGQPARVRLSVTRDPYVPQDGPAGFGTRPSRIDGAVTLWRDGRLVDELAVDDHTCYETSTAVCNAATGEYDRTREGPFECGDYRGSVPMEPGATYVVRAELPGLPPAEGEVVVPLAPALDVVSAEGTAPRRLRVRLTDPAGPGDRYALTVYREVDRTPSSVCAVGGLRDTVYVHGPRPQRTRFASSDPVLVTGARDAGGSLSFVTFPDDAFDGQGRTFELEAPAVEDPDRDTGAFRVEVSALSLVLYDAFQVLTFDLDENPFAEPIDLPLNVSGGYGRLGAVSTTTVRLAPPAGR